MADGQQPYRQSSELRWPPTPNQYADLNAEIDRIYRRLRELWVLAGEAAALSGTVPAASLPAFTGDVTKPAGSTVLTLSGSGVTPGTYGDTTHIPQLTVDAKGRVTVATQVASSGGINGLLTNGDPTYPELIFDSSGDVITT